MVNEQCWIIYYKRYCKWILGRLELESTGSPGSVNFDWEKVEKKRDSIIGFNHTHPSGFKGPSSIDDHTMTGLVKALGKGLICGIKSDKQRFFFYERTKDKKSVCYREIPFIMISNRILAKIG